MPQEDVDTEDTRTDLLEATARMQTLDAFATGVLAFLDTAASDTFLSVKQKESFGLTVSEACYLVFYFFFNKKKKKSVYSITIIPDATTVVIY